MSLAEFASSIQHNSTRTRSGLRFYLQAPLDASLLSSVDLARSPFNLIGDANSSGEASALRSVLGQEKRGGINPPPLAASLSQAPRMWMSAAGSVSPLHFDASPSFLTQVGAPLSQQDCAFWEVWLGGPNPQRYLGNHVTWGSGVLCHRLGRLTQLLVLKISEMLRVWYWCGIGCLGLWVVTAALAQAAIYTGKYDHTNYQISH